ncbi:MAG: HIT family protein [Phycisphaeraceae bacterium]
MPDHPTDPDCIFCKIIAGEIPCHKLYEDDRVLAFLDIGPLSAGHALVIPKGHYELISEVPPEVAAAMFKIVPGLSKAIMQATGALSWNLLQNNGGAAGQVVGHVHLHIIPRPAGDSRDAPIQGNGLPFGWPAGEVNHAEAGKLAQVIQARLA